MTPAPVSRRPARQRTAPSLNRSRRHLPEIEDNVPTPPSSLDLDRTPSAARSGRQEMRELDPGAQRDRPRAHRRRRRRELGRCVRRRRRGPRRRQSDPRPGSRRRHRPRPRRRVPGQRRAQGGREDLRARQASLGARPGVVGRLSGPRLISTEGLRPSDSPTRSLARRFDGALRSRGSLAFARSRVRTRSSRRGVGPAWFHATTPARRSSIPAPS